MSNAATSKRRATTGSSQHLPLYPAHEAVFLAGLKRPRAIISWDGHNTGTAGAGTPRVRPLRRFPHVQPRKYFDSFLSTTPAKPPLPPLEEHSSSASGTWPQSKATMGCPRGQGRLTRERPLRQFPADDACSSVSSPKNGDVTKEGDPNVRKGLRCVSLRCRPLPHDAIYCLNLLTLFDPRVTRGGVGSVT